MIDFDWDRTSLFNKIHCLHYSSPLLHKNCLQKLGNCCDNAIAIKQSKSASFMVAWTECLIIIEFMQQYQESLYRAPAEKCDNPSRQTKKQIVANIPKLDAVIEVKETKDSKNKSRSKDVEKKTEDKENPLTTEEIVKSMQKCRVVLNRIDIANFINPAATISSNKQQQNIAVGAPKIIRMTRQQTKLLAEAAKKNDI